MEENLLRAYRDAERICREPNRSNLKIIAAVLNSISSRPKFGPFTLRKTKQPSVMEIYRKQVQDLVEKELFRNVVEVRREIFKMFEDGSPQVPEGRAFLPLSTVPYPFNTVPLHLVAYNPEWGEQNREVMISMITLHEALHDVFYREGLGITRNPLDEHVLSEVYANVSDAHLTQSWSESIHRIEAAIAKVGYPNSESVATRLAGLLDRKWHDRGGRKEIANLILKSQSLAGLYQALK